MNRCNSCIRNMLNEKTCPYVDKIPYIQGVMLSVEKCNEYIIK